MHFIELSERNHHDDDHMVKSITVFFFPLFYSPKNIKIFNVTPFILNLTFMYGFICVTRAGTGLILNEYYLQYYIIECINKINCLNNKYEADI